MSVQTRLVKLEKDKAATVKRARPRFTEAEYDVEIAALLTPWPDLLAWLYGDPRGPRPDPHRLAAFVCEAAGMTRPGPEYCYMADAKVILPPIRLAAWTVVCFNMSIQRLLDWGAREPPQDGPSNKLFDAWYHEQLELDPVSKRLSDIFFHVWNANDPDDPTEQPRVWTLAGTPECDESCPYFWQSMTYMDGNHPEPRRWLGDYNGDWDKAGAVAEALAAADLTRAEVGA